MNKVIFMCSKYLLEEENIKLKKDLDSACKDKLKISKLNSYFLKKVNTAAENTTINKNVVKL